MQIHNNSVLYVVATPIGNLGDFTFRAIETLKQVDIIAAEDTRHSAKLLQHYHISTPVVAYHDHGSDNQTIRLLEKLRNGQNIALISDAGTPLISDPGYRLVNLAREAGFMVSPIPGACALIASLSAAGLPSNRFSFEGFPPAKSVARRSFFEQVACDERTLIYYESPHRIVDSLCDMAEVFGSDREVVYSREITKSYETFLSMQLGDLLKVVTEDANHRKGECVVVVKGFDEDANNDEIAPETQKLMRLLLKELPTKKAAAIAAETSGEKKNKLYQWALDNPA